MSRRAIRNAIQSRWSSFESSLSCVSLIRPHIIYPIRLEPGANITIALGHPDPDLLRPRSHVSFTAIESIRVERRESNSSHYISSIHRYSYRISFEDGIGEALAFHWEETTDDGGVTYPHLHLGRWFHPRSSLTEIQDIHKLHIPTSAVSLAMIIRFLIEELGVEPLRTKWDEILANVLD